MIFSLLVCCSRIQSKPTDSDQASEHHVMENEHPALVWVDDADLVERAAPRLGRASPRLGRASPRLGRRTAALLFARLNHGRYAFADEDMSNDDASEIDSYNHERRAAPRLGRAIHVHEQEKQV